MYSHKRINNERFTVRFVNTAKYLGFTTVGQFEKFLKRMEPNSKVCFGPGTMRVFKLMSEISHFKAIDEQQ